MIDPVTGQEIPDTGVFKYGALVLREYLKTRVTSIFTVASQVPNPRPSKLITVHGVPIGNHAEGSVLSWRRLVVHNYDTDESLCCRMSEMVRGYLVDGMYTRGSGYRGLRVIGEPVYLPDPEDPQKTPRAQQTVDILLRSTHTPYGPGS